MGVPGLFSWIKRKFPQCMIINSELDVLCIDGNALIYPLISEERKDIDNIDLYIELLNKILKHFNPLKFCILCFDGPPPLFKQFQQRQRRFRTEKLFLNKLTPGTLFMNNLMDKIKKTTFDFQIIFSSSNIYGEGEHKIFDYIRKLKEEITFYILGCDADLLIISLLCENFKNINISRFPMNVLDFDNIETFSINLLKQSLESRYSTSIKDLCFASFFMGNDFVPVQRSCTAFFSFDQICKYTKKFKFIKNNSINLDHLKLFIYFLSKKEFQMIQQTKVLQNDYKENDSEENFRKRYNLKFKEIKEVCKDYIYSIQWCWDYYNGISVDWNFFYKYHHAPLFREIISNWPDDRVEERNFIPRLMNLQLCSVLPPESFIYLPDEQMKKDMEKFKKNNPIYFPENIEYDISGKEKEFQGVCTNLPFPLCQELSIISSREDEKFDRELFLSKNE